MLNWRPLCVDDGTGGVASGNAATSAFKNRYTHWYTRTLGGSLGTRGLCYVSFGMALDTPVRGLYPGHGVHRVLLWRRYVTLLWYLWSRRAPCFAVLPLQACSVVRHCGILTSGAGPLPPSPRLSPRLSIPPPPPVSLSLPPPLPRPFLISPSVFFSFVNGNQNKKN